MACPLASLPSMDTSESTETRSLDSNTDSASSCRLSFNTMADEKNNIICLDSFLTRSFLKLLGILVQWAIRSLSALEVLLGDGQHSGRDDLAADEVEFDAALTQQERVFAEYCGLTTAEEMVAFRKLCGNGKDEEGGDQSEQTAKMLDLVVYQRLGGKIQPNLTFEDVTAFINNTNCEPTKEKNQQNRLALIDDMSVDETGFSRDKRLYLLDTISSVQRQYLQSEGPKVTFGHLLKALLDLMDSEYGFIGEIKYEADGTMFLQTHAITNIAWNKATQDFYASNVDSGLKFYNLNSLFGKVMTTGAPVISNNPRDDPRKCGIPEGHPPLNHFLGIPFFRTGGVMNGMVGIANKPNGFSEKDIEFLEPFTVTCGNLIHAYWQNQRNKELIEGLESKVKERTAALETLNRDLELANKRVVQSAQAQLQHFACMSHEIRTPLNCIVGLSSLMLSQQEEALEEEKKKEEQQLIQHSPILKNDDDAGFQKLTPFQEESVRMIVTSGDLLLTVVNDVLDYSKLESGNVDIEIKPTCLQQVLHAVVHSIEMKLKEKDGGVASSMSAGSTTTEGGGVKIATEFDMKLPMNVQIDGRRLQQILYNLLGNAVKFSPNDGTVELRVEIVEVEDGDSASAPFDDKSDSSDAVEKTPEEEAFAHPTTTSSESRCPFTKTAASTPVDDTTNSKCPFTRQSKGQSEGGCPFSRAVEGNTGNGKRKKMLRFVVKDYGKGIERANFDRIFKPFLQANAETERVYGGTGLGLAITSKLAKTLGGNISVDSEVGKWSEFTVDLPFLDEPVDVTKQRARLQRSVVMMIDNQFATEMGENDRLRAILDYYGVAHRSFACIDSMHEALRAMGPGQAQCVCFVSEDVYSSKRFEQLRVDVPEFVSFVSFGPRFHTSGRSEHIRSIKQMLPSVLVDMLARRTATSRRRCSMLAAGKYNHGENPQASNTQDDSYRLMKVLIAEDNKINQKVLLRMLARLGVNNVTIADNGRIACDMEAAEHFDVCLMDMQMPVMDGLTACREILGRPKREARQGQVPRHDAPAIVFVTAQVSSGFVAECEAAGSSDFLAKPFNIKGIEECLRKIWATRSSG